MVIREKKAIFRHQFKYSLKESRHLIDIPKDFTSIRNPMFKEKKEPKLGHAAQV